MKAPPQKIRDTGALCVLESRAAVEPEKPKHSH